MLSRGKQRKQVNIKNLTSFEIKRLLHSIDYVISDAEDILWKKDDLIPQGVLLVNGLINFKKNYRFILSDTQRSHAELMQRFQDIGVEGIEHSHFLTPGKILLNYLQQCKKDQPIYSLAGDNINCYLKKNGIGVIMPEAKMDVTLENMSKRLKTYCKVGAVVVDHNCNTAWNCFALANCYLKKNPQADLICLNNDIFFPLGNDVCAFGARSIMHVIQGGMCRNPITLCKPNLYVGEDILRYFNIIMPSRVLYIGTSVEKDIMFANVLNFQTVLLKTPKLPIQSYLALPEKYKPNFFAESITDMLCSFDIDYNNSFFS